MTHQKPKLGGALAEGRIAKRLLDHPAMEPGEAGDRFNFVILIMILILGGRQQSNHSDATESFYRLLMLDEYRAGNAVFFFGRGARR